MPGVLVDQQADRLLQSHRYLAQHPPHHLAQLRSISSDWHPLRRSHLSGQFEVLGRAVAGLHHAVARVETGDEDHAETVEIAGAGAAPLVLDLRGCSDDKMR